MTLVLGCLTHRFVVQVSDQQITDAVTGEVLETNRNKATMYCSYMAFAYSGVGTIAGEHTDIWMAKTLGRHTTLNAAGEGLRDEATLEFRRWGAPSARTRHAFVGIGWGMRPGETHFRPLQATISNALDSDGQWLSIARPEFEIDGVGLSEESKYFLCAPIGAPLPDNELRSLKKNMVKCVQQGAAPWAFIRLLGEAIRRVAQGNSEVGSTLNAIVVPPPAPKNGMHVLMTALTPSGLSPLIGTAPLDEPMFLNLSASDEVTQSMPNFACNGGVAVGFRRIPPTMR